MYERFGFLVTVYVWQFGIIIFSGRLWSLAFFGDNLYKGFVLKSPFLLIYIIYVGFLGFFLEICKNLNAKIFL